MTNSNQSQRPDKSEFEKALEKIIKAPKEVVEQAIKKPRDRKG